jgi:hypothetical protein
MRSSYAASDHHENHEEAEKGLYQNSPALSQDTEQEVHSNIPLAQPESRPRIADTSECHDVLS